MADLHIGTSAFTAAGWDGTFYPAGTKAPERPAFYATKFRTVEIYSTYLRHPEASNNPRIHQVKPLRHAFKHGSGLGCSERVEAPL